MEGHISLTSQITDCGKSSLVSRHCRNYGFGSLKCPSNVIVDTKLNGSIVLEQSGLIQLLVFYILYYFLLLIVCVLVLLSFSLLIYRMMSSALYSTGTMSNQ